MGREKAHCSFASSTELSKKEQSLAWYYVFFQGSLCLWLLAQTSPTQEEEKQSYETEWSLRLLQANDKEGDVDNAVALKWHFQRLHKGEKGKAWDGLNNCLSGLWIFQVERRSHGWISLQGNQAYKGFCKGILMQTSCKPVPP